MQGRESDKLEAHELIIRVLVNAGRLNKVPKVPKMTKVPKVKVFYTFKKDLAGGLSRTLAHFISLQTYH